MKIWNFLHYQKDVFHSLKQLQSPTFCQDYEAYNITKRNTDKKCHDYVFICSNFFTPLCL